MILFIQFFISGVFMITDLKIAKELKLYKKMYNHLFNAVTRIIKICQDPVAKNLLITAQQETEEIYVSEDIS